MGEATKGSSENASPEISVKVGDAIQVIMSRPAGERREGEVIALGKGGKIDLIYADLAGRIQMIRGAEFDPTGTKADCWTLPK